MSLDIVAWILLSHLILCLRGFPSFDKTKKKESEGLSETVGARIDGRERKTERERGGGGGKIEKRVELRHRIRKKEGGETKRDENWK